MTHRPAGTHRHPLRRASRVGCLAVALLAGCASTRHRHPPLAVPPPPIAAATAPTTPTTRSAAGLEPVGVLPLPATRPVLNPAVTDATVTSTVCTGTKKYRPPQSYTDTVKRIELATAVGQSGSITDPRSGRTYPVPGYRGYAGLSPADASRVELDHFLPLSDGGDGYDPANLWPELGGTAGATLTGSDGQSANSTVKDQLEAYVYQQLCPRVGGHPRITLAQAQALYEPDWYASYRRLGRPHSPTTSGS